MDYFKLEKPDIAEIDYGLLMELFTSKSEVANTVYASCEPEYLYWDKVRYKTPPEGLTDVAFLLVFTAQRVLDDSILADFARFKTRAYAIRYGLCLQ